jgi:hypothetical protein
MAKATCWFGNVVFCQQDAARSLPGIGVIETVGVGGLLGIRSRLIFKENGEPEYRALSRFTLYTDLAAKEFHQLLRYRQSQSRAAIPSRGGAVHLREGREDIGPPRRRNGGIR